MEPLIAKTRLERILFGNFPEGYPHGHPVGGQQQIPMLNRVNLDVLPVEFVACNDLSRAKGKALAGVHFFKDDIKFLSALSRPLRWMNRLAPFKIVLTPDPSLGTGMPPWQRARNVSLARAAGATWQDRGLVVVPTLRWLGPDDYELAASGVPQESVIAVSSYGSRNNTDDYQIFHRGLVELVGRLEPQAVIVFGTLMDRTLGDLHGRTQLAFFEDPIAEARKLRRIEAAAGGLF